MQRESRSTGAPSWLEPELESVLDAFDEAWTTGIAPNLQGFFARGKRLSPLAQARLLTELIKIDLEYRWRFWVLPVRGSKSDKTVKKPRLVEDYAREYPSLAITAELAAEEWLVRTRFGDRPSRSEYAERFPHLKVALAEQFERLAPAVKGMLTTADRSQETLRDTQPAAPEAVEPTPDPNLWLGRYQVLRQLGKGSFGQVFLAKDPRLDRQVVIKIPHGRGSASPEVRQELLREARLAATLRHPGLVTIYDVVFEENRCAIIMEYVAGGTLGERLASGGTSRLVLLEWVATVAEAVHAAHTAGLVHRDIKPANILLDDLNQPKVADFGLALTERQLKREAWKVTGTPAYMAPEQVRGENHHLDGRADIWSLGVILYEVLTHRRPFSGDSLEELFSQIEFREPKPPRQVLDSVDPELERICLKCLAKPVTARYTTGRDLADDLRRYLARARIQESYQRPADSSRLPTPVAAAAPPLPLPADAFLGRAAELQRLSRWLQDPQRGFLSLLGMGGIGKTRLALQFAQENAAAFPGGLWLVDVSGATGASAVAQAVLMALGIPEWQDQSPVDLVSQVLQHRPPLLMILDGFDRAVGVAAATVGKWVRQQPQSALIVTSRQRLGVPGEFALEIDPLPLPAANAAANEVAANSCVQLLVARATEAGIVGLADAKNAPLLAQICHQLEGIPLAIELAAARLRVLSLPQLQGRLAQKFEVLRSMRRDLPARQQTLLGAIAWSYDLLPAEEQDALLRLSLLPGGCTLDLAEGLLEEVPLAGSDGGRGLDLIQSLRDRCFLRSAESAVGLRFEMFRAIREFCLQQRAERVTPTQTRQDWRRITWRLLKPAGNWRDRLRSAERRLALDWFASERDNLLACQDFALADDDYVTARHIGLLLDEFFAVRGPGAERLARLQKLFAAPGQTNVRLSICLSQAFQAAGKWQAALDAVQPAVASSRTGNARLHGEALLQRASVLRLLGCSDEALADLEALGVAAQQAVPGEAAGAEISAPSLDSLLSAAARERGLLAQQGGAWSEALSQFDRAEQLARDAGDEPALALALRYRGNILVRQGKPALAEPLLQEALSLAERHDDRRLLHLALSSLGMAHAEQGRYAPAIAAYTKAELVARDLGEPRAIATNLGNRGLALADQGDYVEAIECLDKAEAINRQIGSLSGLAVNRTNYGAALLELGRLQDAAHALDEAERLCRARNLQVQLSFVLTELGRLRVREGQPAAAVDCLRAARQCQQDQGRDATVDGFLTLVELAQALGKVKQPAAAEATARQARQLAAELQITGDHARLRVRTALADLDRLLPASPGGIASR